MSRSFIQGYKTVLDESIVGIIGKNGFVGCGFAIAPRYVLTCAHVVVAALGKDSKVAPSEEVTLCFPYLREAPVKARVVYWKPAIHDPQQLPAANLNVEEDIAGLELLEEVPGVKAVRCQPARENTPFKAIGYPKKITQGAIAEGKLQARLPLGWFQLDGECSEGLWAAPGFSGTAIWDRQHEQDVYGMMVAARKDEDRKIAYMIPIEKLENAITHLKLLEILSQIEHTEQLWKVYKSAYQQCQPQGWDYPFPETPSEMLRQLSDVEDSNCRLTFIAHLLAHQDFHAREAQKQYLRDWGINQMPSGSFFDCIDQVRQEVTVQKLEVADACLIVEVFPEHPPYATRAFFIPKTQAYDRKDSKTYKEVFCWDFENRQEKESTAFGATNSEAEVNLALKERLAGYIATCEEKYEINGRFRLELMLPMKLMNLPIERWELECNPYTTIIPASAFPVVIRSRERTTQQYEKALGRKWRDNWQRLQSCRKTLASTGLVQINTKDKPVQLEAHLKANSHMVGFKLSEILQKSDQDKFLAALLGSAAPVAIWLRHTLDHRSEAIVQILDVEVLSLCPSIENLPNQVWRCRAEAIAQSPEPDEQNFRVGHHLSLLWENPHLLPPVVPKNISE